MSEENENVGAGEPVAILNAGERAEAEIAVPDRFIGQIRVGTKATVKISALNGLELEGVVSRIGVAATEAATTFPVKVRFTSEDDRIRSGMTVTATFETKREDGPTVFFVPPRAVLASPEGHTVFVAVPEPGVADRASIERREVTVGRPTIRGVEITSGLKDGDLIVLAGMSQIRAGLVVKLLEETHHHPPPSDSATHFRSSAYPRSRAKVPPRRPRALLQQPPARRRREWNGGAMTFTEAAIKYNRVTIVTLLCVVFGGLFSYQSAPKAEDPGFSIRTAQVITYFPARAPSGSSSS